MRVVVAIPTIEARGNLGDRTAETWERLTPGHEIRCVQSTAGSTWAAGLNDVVQQLDERPDVLVCGSDDMIPADDQWLPAVLFWLGQGRFPAPRVDDPRFVNYGGHPHPVRDGTPAGMSSFPILAGHWLDRVFPLPDDLHYFADNLIAALLGRAGVPCVAVPSARILHMHAMEGRGAGYGTENTRLYVDTVRYTRALEQRDIDRQSLEPGVRGHMWEPHFQEIGKTIGA